MKKQVHNLETDEISLVDYSIQEIKEMESEAKRLRKLIDARDAEMIALQNKKLETFAKLGLTEEEAKLLLS